MLDVSRRSLKLRTGFDAAAFASIVAVVVLTIVIAKSVSVDRHVLSPVAVDPPSAGHAGSMPGALRENAITVLIAEGGQICIGRDWVDSDSLPAKIADRLKGPNVERKVYIVADKKAPWRSVKVVLDGVRSAGIIRVAFLVDQRRVSTLVR